MALHLIKLAAGADSVDELQRRIDRCAIMLDPELVSIAAQPRRAFQGWRYLKVEDAPPDLSGAEASAPLALRAKLAELGLL